MRTPKLGHGRGRDWYAYYAGYSSGFVDDLLDSLELPAGSTVLDPWNGSGTTTARGHARGHNVVGFDLNPALVLVARARLIGAEAAESVEALAVDLLDHARSGVSTAALELEPLSCWLVPEAAAHIRRIERAIQRVLSDPDASDELSAPVDVDATSALAAFFYVALFELIRGAIRSSVGSNPTWVRIPSPDQRVALDAAHIEETFASAAHRLKTLAAGSSSESRASTSLVAQASSTAIPLEEASVDAVISSPPYCTRIDYVVATRPELAVLGYDPRLGLKTLRDRMIGTPTIAEGPIEVDPRWGTTAMTVIDAVSTHASQASPTYYRRQYLQYFEGLFASLTELRRVVRPSAKVALVVQDSFYKDKHVDLPQIVLDMAHSSGWIERNRIDFAIARTKASINPKVREYRSDFSATESVLLLSN